MGVAYNRVGMYSEANAAADYVFDHKLGLGQHGYLVAYTVKATANMGLKDYRTSVEYAKRVFSIEPKYYPVSLVQLAAAETGDLRLLEEMTQQLQAASPEQYSLMKIYSDAVKVYALMKANQVDEALKLMKACKSVESAEGKVIDYWRIVPGGVNVSRTFSELMKN